MSHKAIYYCLLSVSFLMIGCTSQKKEHISQLKTFNVNPPETPNAIPVSEIASRIQFVPLYTDNENLVGDISKVIYANNFLYISDGLSIYKFSIEGALLGKIEKQGGSPDEYIGITDFQVTAEDLVWVLSRDNKSLYNYDWNNEIKESVSLNTWVSNIYIADDHIYLYMGNEIDDNNQSRLTCFNLKTKQVVQKYLDIDAKQAKYLHIMNSEHFNKEQNSLYFFETFNDTVYTVTENGISPVYYLNFDNKNIPASFFDIEYENVMYFFQALFKENYAYGTSLFAKHNEKYMFTYYYKQTCYMHMINEETGVAHTFSSLLEDNELGGYPINLSELAISVYENKIIFPLWPSGIIEYAKENLSESQVEEIIRKLNYNREDQNPVIMLIHI